MTIDNVLNEWKEKKKVFENKELTADEFKKYSVIIANNYIDNGQFSQAQEIIKYLAKKFN